MLDDKFELITVTVRKLRLIDEMHRTRLFAWLSPMFGYNDYNALVLWDFLTLMFTTDSISCFEIPDPQDDFLEWERAWNAYNELSYDFAQAWIAHSNKAQAPEPVPLVPIPISDQRQGV